MRATPNFYKVEVFMRDKQTNEEVSQGVQYVDESTYSMMLSNRSDKNNSGLYVKELEKLPEGLHPSRANHSKKESTKTDIGIDSYDEPPKRGRPKQTQQSAEISVDL